MTAIPVDEIVAVLRRAIAGDLSVKCVGPTWHDVYAGDVSFWFGDWKIEIFNDCDSFDYINAVEAPDGRKAVFEDWWPDREIPICPENQLSESEWERLAELLESAPGISPPVGTSPNPPPSISPNPVPSMSPNPGPLVSPYPGT